MWVVGIGASAGGVEALRELLPTLPTGPVCYLVAQHMSPAHPSLLIQVLSRETELPVREIHDGMPVEAGVIYVAPPNRDVQLIHGVLVTMQAAPRISPQPSIDVLLESIAADVGEAAMGVILSGTGSDGVTGMEQIHRAGGRTLAQDPGSARYRDMPSASIDAGVVDVVLTPTGIGSALAAYLAGERVPASAGRFGDDQVMAALAAQTRRVTGWDIASYKDGTLGRQLTKRVAALGLKSTEDYLQHVLDHPEELEALRDSMLITVTGFLRDRKSFDALAEALRPLVAAKVAGEPLRAWVAGCATGEEAYSIAMLLAETAREQGLDTPVKVFATDISDAAMDTARRGAYPVSALADVPEEWRERYFSVEGELAQVDKRLRDMLVIARQDITRDPPLVRMDLVCCRNLLIYLVAGVQERVLTNLHAALGPNGLLFLGRSEAIPPDTEQFTTVDAASRVFRRRPGTSMPVYTGLPLTPAVSRPTGRAHVARSERDVVRDHVRDRLLAQYGPPSVLIDGGGTPVHTIGDVSRFLSIPGPDADLTITEMITPSLRTEVTSLLTRLHRDGTTVIGHTVVMPTTDGTSQMLRLQAARISLPGAAEPYAMLSFVPAPAARSWADPGSSRATGEAAASLAVEPTDADQMARRIDQLEHELTGTREHLQAVVEELESSNEELQAMNEELQASSEELQATNEELETTNEELQATNEELTTVNETLEVRTAELSEANVVLNNIQSSVHTAIVLVDRDQRLQRFSPLAVKVFGLVAADIGTRLARVPSHLELQDLPTLLDKVMETGEGQVMEVTATSATYLLQVMPYFDGPAIEGAVLALSDITELARARAELTVRAEEFQMIAEAVPHVVFRSSVDGSWTGDVSPTVTDVFGVSVEEVLADPGVLRSLVHPDSAADVAAADRASADADTNVDYRVLRRDGGVRFVREMTRVVRDDRGQPRYRVGTIIDITDIVLAREEADRQRRRAQGIFTAGGTPMMTLTPDGRVVAANAYLADLLARTAESLTGRAVADLMMPDGALATQEALSALVGGDGAEPVTFRVRFHAGDGSLVHVDQTLAMVDVPSPAAGADGSFVFASLRDVTDAELARREAAATLAQLESVFEGSSAAMSVTSLDGHIVRPNRAMCQLFECGPDDLVGKHFAELTYSDDLPEETKLFGELLRGDRDRYSLVKRCVTTTGQVVWGQLTVQVAPSPNPDDRPVLISTLLDVTKEMDREAAALRIAQTDPLTGLLNRSLIIDRLRQAINRAHRTGEHVSVLFIDLDEFKAINDRLGHAAGDAVLKTVALRLRALTREGDSIARLGGDEFLVIAPHEVHDPPHAGARLAHQLLESVADPIGSSAADGESLASRALGELREGIDVGQSVPLSVSASIGVAHYPNDGDDADGLIRKADIALYSAKQRGGGQVTFYSAQLQDSAELRSAQRAELLAGLTREEFLPYYQPIVDARTGRPVDMEILVRWQHPDRGLLPPTDFLRLAAEFDRLQQLTDLLLEQVVRDVSLLRERVPGLGISVNVDPAQLRHADVVDRLVARLGSDLSGWTIEVTEAAAFGSDATIAGALDRLRDMGARTSLDDFGSGYSSPLQLRGLGFDEVKIDRGFVCDSANPADCALVRAIVAMAHALGAVTVAEGVESADQAAALAALGVDRLQGFHYAAPMPLAEALAWLSATADGR